MTGEPDTPRPGDQGTAWASATPDGQLEWLICEFKAPKDPIEIVVHENNAPGAITKIGIFKDDDTEVTAWEGTDPTPRDQPWGISVFPLKVDFAFKKLKLYINSPPRLKRSSSVMPAPTVSESLPTISSVIASCIEP